MESTSPGEPVKGQCSECVDQFDQTIKRFGRTFNGTRKIKGKAPDLEMPNLDPELQTEFGLGQEATSTDPEPEVGFEVQRKDWDD